MTPREYLRRLDTPNTVHRPNRTLFEHLCAVEDILRLCRVPEHVALAGLYHSVYGTGSFLKSSTQDRRAVQEIIGERAEYLVWVFSNASRPFCWFTGNYFVLADGTALELSDTTLWELQMIEGANLLEQQTGADFIVSFTANHQTGSVRQ